MKRRSKRSLLTLSWRVGAGIALLVVSLGLKMYYDHKFETYSTLYTANMFMNVAGLVLLFLPAFQRIDGQMPTSFQLYPKKWTTSILKQVSVAMMIAIIGLLLFEGGSYLNKVWVNYQIDRNPVEVVGEMEYEIEISLPGRFGRSSERFVVIGYSVDDKSYHLKSRIIRQQKVVSGKKIMVKYLKTDPNLAIVGELGL